VRYDGELQIALHSQRLTIAYSETLGDPQKTPILYLPGWGCTKEDIHNAPIDPNLADRRIVAFDYPGYGGSSSPSPYPFKFNHWSYFTLASIMYQRLKLGRTAVVGHSAGGADAIYFASNMPSENTAGLVSVMGNMQPSDCFLTSQIADMSDNQLVSSGFSSYVLRLAASKNPGMQQYASRISRFDKNSMLTYRNHARSIITQCQTSKLLAHFLAFSGPKLFIHGEAEQADCLDQLRANDVPIATIGNADHFPFVDNPAEYYKALGDFMVRLDEARA